MSNILESDKLYSTTAKINADNNTVLRLDSSLPGDANILQQPGTGSTLGFMVPTSSNPGKNGQSTSGLIKVVSRNITQNEDTFDMEFSLAHRKNGDSVSSPNTRMILSSGFKDQNNQNKLVLVNPYASDGNGDRKSTLQYRGFKATNEVTGSAQGGSGTTITLQANSSSINDYYNNFKIEMTSGNCLGQTAFITDYNGTTKVASINKTWSNSQTPSSGDEYKIFSFSNLGEIQVFHSGTGSDDKGVMRFNVNDGGDTQDNLHTIMELRPKTNYHSGTAHEGVDNTITLDTNASSSDDYFNNYYILITGGTGSGQTLKILDYDGDTRVATVDANCTTNLDNTSTFEIYDASVTIYGDLNINRTVTSTNTTYEDTLVKLGQGLL